MSFEEYETQQSLKKTRILVLFLFFVAIFLCAPLIGSQHIDLIRALKDPGSPDANILFTIRLPSVLLGALAGAALAVCGMVFQAILKNPLASPYTLGVASGASFGAVLTILLDMDSLFFLGLSFISVMSFLGALFSILLVYIVAQKKSSISTYSLLMAGIAMNLLFSSLILCCQYCANFTQTNQILHWLIGGIDIIGFKDIYKAIPLFLIGIFIIFVNLNKLNLVAMGDEIAYSRGVNVLRTQRMCFFSSSLVIGAVVCLSGPISFVGLIIPHLVRMILGPDHKYLFWGCIFLGATFLIICDTISRTILAPRMIPIGVVTVLFGAPFFIYLLKGID